MPRRRPPVCCTLLTMTQIIYGANHAPPGHIGDYPSLVTSLGWSFKLLFLTFMSERKKDLVLILVVIHDKNLLVSVMRRLPGAMVSHRHSSDSLYTSRFVQEIHFARLNPRCDAIRNGQRPSTST